MTYQEKYEKILIGIVVFLTISVIVFMLVGCVSQPDKKNYNDVAISCYQFDMCLYYNQKNPDKSVCIDYAKECRSYGRYNFCKDANNRPLNIDFTGCQLWLNQK